MRTVEVANFLPGMIAKQYARFVPEQRDVAVYTLFLLERVADLPVMAERIDNSSEPPAVVVIDRYNFFRTGGNGLGKDGIRVRNDQDHSRCTAFKGFRAEVIMLGRFVGHPKVRTVDRKRCYNRTRVIEKKNFLCTERRLVEFNSSFSVSDGQHRLDLSFDNSTHSSSRDKISCEYKNVFKKCSRYFFRSDGIRTKAGSLRAGSIHRTRSAQGVGVTGGGFLGVVGSSPGGGVGYAVGLGDAVGVAVGVGVGSELAAEFPLMAAPINPEIASTQAVNKSALLRFIRLPPYQVVA